MGLGSEGGHSCGHLICFLSLGVPLKHIQNYRSYKSGTLKRKPSLYRISRLSRIRGSQIYHMHMSVLSIYLRFFRNLRGLMRISQKLKLRIWNLKTLKLSDLGYQSLSLDYCILALLEDSLGFWRKPLSLKTKNQEYRKPSPCQKLRIS